MLLHRGSDPHLHFYVPPPGPPKPPHAQVRFLSTNKHLYQLGNSSRVLWAELRKVLRSPRATELFGVWLRPKAQLLQKLAVELERSVDDPQEADPAPHHRWEAAKHFLLGCIAGSTSLRGLYLVSSVGEVSADSSCAALPSLRWAGTSGPF